MGSSYSDVRRNIDLNIDSKQNYKAYLFGNRSMMAFTEGLCVMDVISQHFLGFTHCWIVWSFLFPDISLHTRYRPFPAIDANLINTQSREQDSAIRMKTSR